MKKLLTVIVALTLFVWNQYIGPKLQPQVEIPPQTTTTQNNEIPAYTGKAYTVLNNNIPTFTKKELETIRDIQLDELDHLKRCGTTIGYLGPETLPKKKREPIGMVRPSGWHLAKYDFIDQKYCYNRCHLIGFQLSGLNADPRNLITGTRYLNVIGMLPFENRTTDYIKQTKNHVLYKVRPLFKGNNLVAHGVQMEAKSIEDNGRLHFNVFVHNIQPGVEIDYATGKTKERKK